MKITKETKKSNKIVRKCFLPETNLLPEKPMLITHAQSLFVKISIDKAINSMRKCNSELIIKNKDKFIKKSQSFVCSEKNQKTIEEDCPKIDLFSNNSNIINNNIELNEKIDSIKEDGFIKFPKSISTPNLFVNISPFALNIYSKRKKLSATIDFENNVSKEENINICPIKINHESAKFIFPKSISLDKFLNNNQKVKNNNFYEIGDLIRKNINLKAVIIL